MAREDERGVDHVIRGRGHPEALELGRVVIARLEGLVGEEADAPARRAQGADRLGRPGNERLAEVYGAVEIEEPAAVRKPDGQLAKERQDRRLSQIEERRGKETQLYDAPQGDHHRE